jgi:hypothetical protein
MTNQATYPGDCTPINESTYVGPDRFQAFYRPVSATHDAEADRTTIQYKPVPMSEMGTRYSHLIDQAIDRNELAQLFGGAR